MTGTAINSAAGSRRALRRAVQLDCGVRSGWWSGALRFEASDLSAHGLWLDTDLALPPGEPVHLRLTPPRWPVWSPPLDAQARVVRVSLSRRRRDRSRSGMGLAFVGLSPVEAGLLSLALRGLPPPLPSRRMRPAIQTPDAVVPVLASDARHASLATLPSRADHAPDVDATELQFLALAPLLTAGRIVVPPPAGRAVVIPFPMPAAPTPGAAAPVALRLIRLRECDSVRSH